MAVAPMEKYQSLSDILKTSVLLKLIQSAQLNDRCEFEYIRLEKPLNQSRGLASNAQSPIQIRYPARKQNQLHQLQRVRCDQPHRQASFERASNVVPLKQHRWQNALNAQP